MNFSKIIDLSRFWNKGVCLFGAGECGSGWGYRILKSLGFKMKFYVDNYPKVGSCNGLPVYSPDILSELKEEILCIVTVYGENGKAICDQLDDMCIRNYYWMHEGDDDKEDLAQYLDELGDFELTTRFDYLLNDKLYLKERFKVRMGYDLDLDNPKTFNEKLQWIKIYDRKPEYTSMVDKYEVKKYVADRIGQEYVIPAIGVYDKFDDIDFEKLPDSFVLKCTHDSGSIVFCKGKKSFDVENAKRILEEARRKNYFWPDREWPYYNVPRRIIAERMIGDMHKSLDVYKIFNFSGKPKLIQVIQDDKTSKESIDYFDVEWNLLELRQNFPNSSSHLPKPKELGRMLELAEILSERLPFIRTDFYIVDGKIYFSEFTFFSDSGAERFYPEEWDYKLGDLIVINN